MEEVEEAGARVAFDRREAATTEPWHRQVSLEMNLISYILSGPGQEVKPLSNANLLFFSWAPQGADSGRLTALACPPMRNF